MKNKYEIEVSVIIPAYNVECYIERCIISLLKQTEKNFEVIIVNDGSSDGTEQICKKYCELDSRFRYYEKKNEGQAVARNFAISRSYGKYLVFIDADDWVDENYIGVLLDKIKSSNADIVLCDYMEHSLNGEIRERKQNFEKGTNILTKVISALCMKIWKKDIFIENHIQIPKMYFEDVAVVPYLLLKAEKIEYVESTAYHYMRNAESTTFRLETVDDRYASLQYLVNMFNEEELIKYNEKLREFIIFRCQINYDVTESIYQQKLKQMSDKQYNIFSKLAISSEEGIKKNEFVWGSYNLYRIAKYLGYVNVLWKFNASSLISATSPVIQEINHYQIHKPVLFRKNNLIYDCTKRFMSMNPGELTDINIVLIDFLEERFPVGGKQDRYITLSDVFYEEDIPFKSEIFLDIFSRKTQWYEACDKFIEKIKYCFQDCRIVLVKMKLAEYYGEDGKEYLYDNIQEIRDINTILEEYYQYFYFKVPECIVIELEDEDCYYTEKDFRYGCEPWHLNEEAYLRLGMKILKLLEDIKE